MVEGSQHVQYSQASSNEQQSESQGASESLASLSDAYYNVLAQSRDLNRCGLRIDLLASFELPSNQNRAKVLQDCLMRRRELKSRALAYATCWNPQFSKRFPHALPREIRDTIYDHLLRLEKEGSLVSVETRDSRGMAFSTRLLKGRIAHYADKNLFGTTFRREFAEIFYLRTWFMMEAGDCADLRDLLHLDAFGSDCKPLTFIRKVTLLISNMTDVSELKESLSLLMNTEVRPGLTLMLFCRSSRSSFTAGLEKLKDELNVTVEALRSWGISVQYSGTWRNS